MLRIKISFLLFVLPVVICAQEKDTLSTGNVFTDLNAARAMLLRWNDAINNRNANELSSVYASEVKYYMVMRKGEECVASKIKTLKKQPSFSQKLKNISLYTIENGNITDIMAECVKVCKEPTGVKEYNALFLFRKIGNEWKMARETDIITEVKQVKFKPIINLPNGEYHFKREYWKDNRQDKVNAHDLILYWYNLDVNAANGFVSGTMRIYSGALRQVTNYPILSGTVKDGILQIKTGVETSEGEINSDNPETMNFKIVSKEEIVLLNEEMPWLYGKPMFDKK